MPTASGVRWLVCLAVLLAELAPAAPARAEDAWKDLYPGIRYLQRSAPGRRYHVVTVHIIRDEFAIRATGADERGQTTLAFAKQVGAAVAVNGDSFEPAGFVPRGPAAGGGKLWPASAARGEHGFFACDAKKACQIDKRAGKAPASWANAVSGDPSLLVRDGKPRSAEEDAACGAPCLAEQPRTAVGLDKDRAMLFILVAEGGQPDAKGASLHEVAQVLAGLGAYRAVNLDGGPSSGLVINGKQVNRLPEGQAAPRKIANHLAVVYTPPQDNCSLATRLACSRYGCNCVDDECSGAFCPGDGCTEQARAGCRHYGCLCVDMHCSGGFCPGSGCTARMVIDCKKRECGCVNGQCAGGLCSNNGCTTKQTNDCAKFGCRCVSGKCSGASCEGSGCEPSQINACAKYGCGCVDGKCSGGYCPGSGCTARQSKECKQKGCRCVDGVCSGGRCAGSGCTAKQVADCNAKSCGCAGGVCKGGRCGAGCACQLGVRPVRLGVPGFVLLVLLVAITVRVRRRGRRMPER